MSFGRLNDRAWKQHGIKLDTKIQVYKAVVLSNLLYGCETWIVYRRHLQQLDIFHMRRLCITMKIKLQDKASNNEVFEHSNTSGVDHDSTA